MSGALPDGPAAPAPPDLEELLERRAQRVRVPALPLADESAVWIAEFPVGDLRCAVPLEDLRAAVPLRAVTPVPLAAPHVIGVLRFHGQVISALSLGVLLGGTGWREDPVVLLVIDRGGGRPLRGRLRRHPQADQRSPRAHRGGARAGRRPGRHPLAAGPRELRLLDLPALLRAREGAHVG